MIEGARVLSSGLARETPRWRGGAGVIYYAKGVQRHVELKNKKHERFCQEYLIDLNATQAYLRAGYNSRNPSARASELRAKPSISARIDRLLAERSARTGINQDRVVRELARIAFLDPTQLVDLQDATVLESATEDDRAAIAGVKVKEGSDWTEREVRFVDKLKALELLGKHLGMYQDNININSPLPVIINDLSGADE
jgi:phage terminase small subunit